MIMKLLQNVLCIFYTQVVPVKASILNHKYCIYVNIIGFPLEQLLSRWQQWGPLADFQCSQSQHVINQG